MDMKNLLDRRFRLLGTASPLFYEKPLHLVKGDGVWLFDNEGKRYLDAYNNVAHVGHCHPQVVDALTKQAKSLNTHTRYLHEEILNYGEQLTECFDQSLSMLNLCCSGTEANELALRIAKTCTGADGVIVTDFCYHGNSESISRISTAFMDLKSLSNNVAIIRFPDPYREKLQLHEFSNQVSNAINSLSKNGHKPAALIIDTIFATEGMPRVRKDFVQKAIELVRKAGGLYIADEVQPGFGRTGTNMWGYELYETVPDLVTLGKPMGNGFPLAGVVGKSDLMKEFGKLTSYFNTFGGNPVAAAVGLTVLKIIREEHLMENALEVGNYMQANLQTLTKKYDILGDVKGHGLFIGADFVKDRASKAPAASATHQVVNSMKERGVLISQTGRDDNILKIRPPMTFSRNNADFLLQTLGDCLDKL